MKKTIHLIGNAHLDPVWLWDRREGLNEGITTVRTMLDLIEEFPEMTFIRGEAAICQHIEKYDPRPLGLLEGFGVPQRQLAEIFHL